MKKIEKHNVTIAVNVLYAKIENIYPGYISKYNSNRKKQVIKQRFQTEKTMALSCSKKLSVLLRRITSMHYGDFNCLNCLHSFPKKEKLESHKKVHENKDFCNVIMPSVDTKLLEFDQYQKSDKEPFITDADLECIIEKIDECKNNPENSSTAKVSEHIPSGFSMSARLSFRSIKNKHDVYRGKECMKIFCEFLIEHAMKIINLKKKKRSY